MTLANTDAAVEQDAQSPIERKTDLATDVDVSTTKKPKKRHKKPEAQATNADTSNVTKAMAEVKSAEVKKLRHAAQNSGYTPWYVHKGTAKFERQMQTSMPYIVHKLALSSQPAIDAYERSYQVFSEALFTLSVMMRAFKSEEICLEVDQLVNTKIDSVAAKIDLFTQQIAHTADSNGLELAELQTQFTKPTEFEVKIVSPREMRVIGLLRRIDSMMGNAHGLWILGFMNDRSHHRIKFETVRTMMRAANDARNLVYRAQAAAQRFNATTPQDPRTGTALDPSSGVTTDTAIATTTPEVPDPSIAIASVVHPDVASTEAVS